MSTMVQSLLCSFFDYKTEKLVIAHNRAVGVLLRAIQLAVLAYLIGWVFVTKKAYQETDTGIESSVITKVKGAAALLDAHVWDAADYVIPPQGENVFFVVTNMIATPGQCQGVCPENPDIPGAHCSNDSDCPSGEPMATGNGVRTGRCVASGESGRRSCEVRAWCPVESGGGVTPRHLILAGAENFTVFIKNSIHFPKFSFRKHNVLEGDGGDGDALKRCRYDAASAPDCPVFRLGDLVTSAGVTRFDAIAVKGGVIGVRIGWQCDLDRPPSECVPTYAFSRLDTDAADVATGYNFRFGRYYQVNGVEHRTLMKVYGIRFDVMVHGKAGKFNIAPTLANVGAGLALLGVGVFLCDLVLLYISKKSPFYRERKYEEASVADYDFRDFLKSEILLMYIQSMPRSEI
ncbi:unnamed protein product [Lampetra planeri]